MKPCSRWPPRRALLLLLGLAFVLSCTEQGPPGPPPELFACADGQGAVPEAYRCDGRQDCIDASDEADCGFACFADGGIESVKLEAVCDDVLDCSNGADEVNVDFEGKQCTHFFACAKSQAWMSSDVTCDFYFDCPDGSDELAEAGCEPKFPIVRCADGGGIAFACDGRVECADRSDELGPECDPFSCADGTVIPRPFACDGLADCPQADDEPDDDCADRRFQCATGARFVPLSWRCDVRVDCADGSDEAGCKGQIFDCEDGLNQLPLVALCDGVKDCANGRDEDAEIACPETAFACADGTLIPCIYHCDGTDDCAREDDEADCPELSCDGGATYPAGLRCDEVFFCADRSDEADCPFGGPLGLCPQRSTAR